MQSLWWEMASISNATVMNQTTADVGRAITMASIIVHAHAQSYGYDNGYVAMAISRCPSPQSDGHDLSCGNVDYHS